MQLWQKFSVSSTSLLIRESVKQVTYGHCPTSACCPAVCTLSPRQTVHVVKFPKPPHINWTKFLHRFWCPASFSMLLSPALPSHKPSSIRAVWRRHLKHSAQCLSYTAALDKLSHGHLLTILATPVCSSAAGPLTCSITTLNSVVVLLYSESKVSTNINQWERALKNMTYTESTLRRLLLSFPPILLLQSHPCKPSPDHVLVKGFTSLKNTLNILKDILRMVEHLI